MRRLLSAVIIFAPIVSFAGLTTSISCKTGPYIIELSDNVNENLKAPASVVQVFKGKAIVSQEFYKMSYQVDEKTGYEVWEYTHGESGSEDGVVGVAATSPTEGKAEIFIKLNPTEAVDSDSADCVLHR